MNARDTFWCTAEEIVRQAAGRPGSERRAFLKGACGPDEMLRARVESLLAELAVPVGVQTSTLTPASHPLTARIDRYRLLRQIGEGGFGTVYLAEQERPVRRRVALKVIKRGMDTKQVIARFEAERQALALMDHPNIARVLDAGTTPEGLPFFVMELVRGTPVTQYCDEGRLATRQRLGLFLQVCQAVQHAHQKGVIHRDLKPGNVLVTRHDVTAPVVPKVIDFGIAKAIHVPLTDKTVHTELRQMMGTPEYMSPEQADMSNLDIDTRSDVYSLGVLLYELLTGTTPVDSKVLRGKPCAEIQRTIREVEPPRPSTRLATLGERLTEVAARRATDPGRLAQSLRGELDWVVMKCLEKDRTRRYDSAGDLAADVQRYLADEPVLARSSGMLYRAGKFARKHKAPAAAAGAVAAALVLGLAGTLLGLARAQDQRDEAVRARASESAQRQAAERAREDAETANRFLLSLHSVAAPYDDTRSIRERLSEVAAKLEGGWLADQPRVRIAVLSALGEGYRGLGDYPRSERQLRSALELTREVFGERHPEVGCQLHLLGSLFETKRDYAEAERCFRDALSLFRASAAGGEHVSMVLNPRRAKDLGVRRGVDAHLSMVITLRDLSFVREKQGDPAGAKALRRESHEAGIAWRTHEMAVSPDEWYLVFTRGMLHARLGRLEPALADVRRAVELNPADHWGWYYAGYLQLYLGDDEAYRRTCRGMLARFMDAPSHEARWRTIEACLLAPGAADDLAPLRSAVDAALAEENTEAFVFWLRLYKGMVHYRAGEFEPALESLAKARAASATYVQAPAYFFTAMASHRLGRTAEADAALARGAALVENRMPRIGRGDLGSNPEHWLLCQLSRREAEHLLHPTTPATPATRPVSPRSPEPNAAPE